MRAISATNWEKPVESSLMVLVLAGAEAFAGAQTITEFALPPSISNPPISNPSGIAAGPDGNVWFTETYANNIGRITPAGVITEFPVGGIQLGIAAGPDGALWTTTNRGLRRMLPSDPNTFVEYPTVLPVTTCAGLTSGPDGNIWFTETDHSSRSVRVARIDLTNLNGCSANSSLCITEFVIPGGIDVGYTGIVSGPDGAIWFTDSGKVGRITTAGVLTQFNAASATPQGGITRGPDGALWYAGNNNKIGRITTAGVLTEFQVPPSGFSPRQITAGPDGNIWFTEITAQKIGRVNLGGAGPTPTRTATFSVTPTPTRTPTGTSSGAPRGRVTPVFQPTPRSNIGGRQ